MREIRPSGSEGGGTESNRFSLPLSTGLNVHPILGHCTSPGSAVVPAALGILLQPARRRRPLGSLRQCIPGLSRNSEGSINFLSATAPYAGGGCDANPVSSIGA